MSHPRSTATSSLPTGTPSPGAKPALGYGERIALAASSLSALGLAPTGAEAALIQVNDNPVSLSFITGGNAEWDVDGQNGSDFHLFKDIFSVYLGSEGARNGRGLVGPAFFYTDNVQALRQSFSVGPTLANGYVWGRANYTYRNAMANYDNGNVGGPNFWIGYDFNYGFTPGDNFFGFRFLNENDELLYGVGVINFDLVNGVVTIDRWAYDSTPGTPVHVAAIANNVPEPGTDSLALIGLGAGGVRAWRARKKAEALKAA